MSQCVPNWEADLRHSPPPPPPPPAPLPSKTTVIGTTTSHPNSNSAPSLSMYDYDVAELTWENGQLALHGLGPPRINNPNSPSCNKYTWEKLHTSGTLESIVNQAAHPQPIKSLSGSQNAWFDHHHSTSTMDALVPSSNRTFSNNDNCSTVVPKLAAGTTRAKEDEVFFKLNNTSSLKRQRVVPVQQPVPVAQVGSSSNNQSLSGSTNSVRENWHVTVDTCDMETDVGLTCASTFGGSLGNTISGKLSPSCTKPITIISDHDSDNSQSRSDHHQMKKGGRVEGDKKNRGHSGKSSVSTRRSRAAAIHNQSERKRRDKINQKMKALQKLVPNSSKADKASMLDEVIEYIKQLQAQVDVMNKPMMMSNIPPNMMMPPMTMHTMQQQLQMSAALMAQMGMSMGPMGMGTGGLLDLSQMGHHRNNIAGISPFFHPSATVMAADPAMSAFLACQQSQQQQQQQQMTMETYSRMAAALYQQLNHTQTLAPVIPNSKS